MTQVSRREFGKTVAAAGVATALSGGRVLGANDRVRLGFIGVGNRGDQVLDAFLPHKDMEVVAICARWSTSSHGSHGSRGFRFSLPGSDPS